MTEPTQAKRAAAASVARITAEAMLREKQDTGLKSIFSKAELKIIDKWIIDNDPILDRSEAIRRLVELGLAKSSPSDRLPATRAADLAERAIEKVSDPAAPPEERAQRRQRLTKGPSEFRDVRVDVPKAKKK